MYGKKWKLRLGSQTKLSRESLGLLPVHCLTSHSSMARSGHFLASQISWMQGLCLVHSWTLTVPGMSYYNGNEDDKYELNLERLTVCQAVGQRPCLLTESSQPCKFVFSLSSSYRWNWYSKRLSKLPRITVRDGDGMWIQIWFQNLDLYLGLI